MGPLIHDYRTLGLQSLDILLCEGLYKTSRVIQGFQRFAGAPPRAARISHVANIAGRQEELRVQEATTLGIGGKKGVQENGLERYMDLYNGNIWVRQLSFDRTEEFYRTDQFFWWDNWEKKYESGIPGKIQLLLAGLRWHLIMREIIKSYKLPETPELHCTELGANRIEVHKLWNCIIYPSRMPPHLWWDEPISSALKCKISEPKLIKWVG